MALSEQRLSNGLNDKGNMVRFPRETFLQIDQIGFEAHPASRLMATGGRKAAQGLSMLGNLLSRRSGLSISNSILLCQLLFRSVVEYACLVWRFAARTHANNLPVAQFAVFASQRAHLSIFLPTKSVQKPRILTKNQLMWGTSVRQISRHLCRLVISRRVEAARTQAASELCREIFAVPDRFSVILLSCTLRARL
jgi:nitrogen fixation protein